jgi:hypothetical protein
MSDDRSTQSLHRSLEASRRRIHPLVWALAGGLVVGIIAFASFLAYTHSTATPAESASDGGPKGGSAHLTNYCTKGPVEVSVVVRQQVALGLHLTPEDLSAKLTSGQTILEVAAQQQVSADQLYTIEVNAYIAAHSQLVSEGQITQQQADQYDANIRQADANNLNTQVQADCLRPAGDASTQWCANSTPSR